MEKFTEERFVMVVFAKVFIVIIISVGLKPLVFFPMEPQISTY